MKKKKTGGNEDKECFIYKVYVILDTFSLG